MIERREGHYSKKSLIIYSFLFIPFLMGLIGFNVLLLYSTTDFLLGLLIELAKIFAIPINVFLIIMSGGLGIPFVLAWRKFFIYMGPKNKIKYSISDVEENILQVLTENEGKSLSRLVLIRKVNFPGTLKEFTEVLNQLWQEDKIKREFQDYPRYSAV